jgi:hypothetical protein
VNQETDSSNRDSKGKKETKRSAERGDELRSWKEEEVTQGKEVVGKLPLKTTIPNQEMELRTLQDKEIMCPAQNTPKHGTIKYENNDSY